MLCYNCKITAFEHNRKGMRNVMRKGARARSASILRGRHILIGSSFPLISKQFPHGIAAMVTNLPQQSHWALNRENQTVLFRFCASMGYRPQRVGANRTVPQFGPSDLLSESPILVLSQCLPPVTESVAKPFDLTLFPDENRAVFRINVCGRAWGPTPLHA